VGSLPGSFILGLIWSLAQVPSIMSEETYQNDLPVVPFVLETVALSIIMTWVFNNKWGSVFVATVFHVMDDVAHRPDRER